MPSTHCDLPPLNSGSMWCDNILPLNYLYYFFIFNAHEDSDFFLTPLFSTVLCSLNRGDEQCMLFEFIHSFIHWIYLLRNWTWNISSFLLSWENSMFPIPLLHQKFMVFNVYGIYHHVFTLLKQGIEKQHGIMKNTSISNFMLTIQ